MRRRALAIVALLAALGSGGCIQRAVLLPVLAPTLEALASVSRPAKGTAIVDAAGEVEAQASREVRRFAVRSSDSKLEVSGGDLLTGMHVMRFGTWRGALFVDGASPPDRPSGHLKLDVALSTLSTDSVVDDSLRYHLLEVDRYPTARFSGTLRPRDDQVDGYIFVGRVLLHGVERVIRFYTDVRREGDDYHIDAVFDMSRDAFGMHRKDTIDLVIYDDFRVVLALVAHPERASAEVVPAR